MEAPAGFAGTGKTGAAPPEDRLDGWYAPCIAALASDGNSARGGTALNMR